MHASTSLDRSITLAEHVAQATRCIRQAPEDADLRARLGQWLIVQGDWDRAQAQVRLAAKLQAQRDGVPNATLMLYDGAIDAEREREAVLAGRSTMELDEDAPVWLKQLTLALQCQAHDQAGPAAELRQAALADAPANRGSLRAAAHDGEHADAFDWLCDGDGRLGPVFEVFVHGRYRWIPCADVSRVAFAPPQGLTDLVWHMAGLTLRDGRQLPALMPARYPVDHASAGDAGDALRLGRYSDWRALDDDTCIGLGQRVWLTDGAQYAMLDTREIVFDET